MSRRKNKPASASRPGAAARPSRGWRPLWIGLGLAALTAIVFAPVRRFEFVNWDDPTYITENPNIPAGLTIRSIVWALTTAYSPYWHPVTWLSHLLDVQMYGLDAGPHHVTSLVIHVANTLLMFGLLRKMTGATGRSAFVAALFAVHPLHVESVAWIAERKDVVSTFFWALTLWAYLAYVRTRRWSRYVGVAALFALALAAKPMVVTLPVVLLLIDIWPLGRVGLAQGDGPAWRRAIAEKVPLLLLGVATSVATIMVQHRVGAMATLEALPWRARASNAMVAYVEYLWKAVWPTHLAAFYPLHDYSVLTVVIAAAALVAGTMLVFRYRRRRPYLLVGWLWYLVTLAPVVGLFQAGEQRLADRFMYVPLIGLLLVVAWGVPDLLQRWPSRHVVLAAASAAVIAACAAASRAQVEHWSDSVALWEHATRATPDSYIAFENLGQALRERGRLEEAKASYQRALELAPGGSPAYRAVIANSLGIVLTRQGRPHEAAAEFEAAVRWNPDFGEARSNLGNAVAAEGRFAEAIEHYRAAARITPGSTEALVGLGSALLSLGQAQAAIGPYREALALDPQLAEAHNGLGAALATQGQTEQALEHYSEALRLKPALPTAHLNIAVLLLKQGDLAGAKLHLQRALAIDPQYQPARDLLSRIDM